MHRIKSLFGILLILGGAYIAFQLLPPYYNNYQFKDTMESEARLNSYNTKSEQEIHDGLIKKAHELDIPLTDNQLHVTRSGAELSVWADYTVHVDLPLHPVDLHFTPSSKNVRVQ